jgi:plastocyanin
MPFYVVGSGGELADVFVTLKGVTGKSTGASAPPALMDQKGCQYIPYVMAVQTGQTLQVKNSDPLLHNVHPTPSKDGGNKDKEANQAQLAGGPDLKFSFPAAEKFLRFKCDVHPWMFSYVCVEDHPYFAVSGKDGKFTIKNVPAGKYTVEATHRKGGSVTKEIEVKDGAVTADFEIEAK